jgi:hypothetical protein
VEQKSADDPEGAGGLKHDKHKDFEYTNKHGEPLPDQPNEHTNWRPWGCLPSEEASSSGNLLTSQRALFLAA